MANRSPTHMVLRFLQLTVVTLLFGCLSAYYRAIEDTKQLHEVAALFGFGGLWAVFLALSVVDSRAR